jgi:hypothetical protein
LTLTIHKSQNLFCLCTLYVEWQCRPEHHLFMLLSAAAESPAVPGYNSALQVELLQGQPLPKSARLYSQPVQPHTLSPNAAQHSTLQPRRLLLWIRSCPPSLGNCCLIMTTGSETPNCHAPPRTLPPTCCGYNEHCGVTGGARLGLHPTAITPPVQALCQRQEGAMQEERLLHPDQVPARGRPSEEVATRLNLGAGSAQL